MSVADWIIGVPVLLAILYYLFVGVWTFTTEFVPEAYRVFRYDRRGICPQCKLPFSYGVAKVADQMYGPDRITQGVCPNGHVSIPQGNRRFAEW